MRELNLAQHRGKVVLCHPWLELGEEVSHILESAHEEQHAGELETSMMLHLAPQQVGDERVDHVPDVDPVYFDYTPMKEFCPDGVWGRPSLATAEKGEKLLTVMVARTTARIEETFRRLRVVRE